MSIPSISSSGKASPQSIITISSLYSNTVRFFPISFNPPKGIILRLFFGFCLFLFIFSLLHYYCFVCFSKGCQEPSARLPVQLLSCFFLFLFRFPFHLPLPVKRRSYHGQDLLHCKSGS